MDKKPTNLTVGASKEDEKQKSENNNKQQQSVTTSTSLEKKSELILMKLQAIDSIEHSGLYKLSSDQRIYLKDQKKHLEDMLNKILRIYLATGNCTGWTDLKFKQTEYYEHKKVKLNLPYEEAAEAAMRQCAVKQLLFNALSAIETKKRVYCSDLMDATLCMHAKYEYDPNCDKCTNRRADYEDRKKRLDVLFKSPSRAKLQEPSKPATVTAPWEQEWSPPSYYPLPKQPEFGCYQLFPSDPWLPSLFFSKPDAGPIARRVNRVEPGQQTQDATTCFVEPPIGSLSADDVTRSVPTVVTQSEKEVETYASIVAREPEQEDDDRELDLEVERYTTKSQAEEANASVEPATLQQNMSTPSGQNVDDDDVTRSVPTVVVESEKETETNASTMACEPEQEDDDRELDIEVERYTTKWQAEEANASVEPATMQQNMSTPSGQNVDDDVTRSVPTVAVQGEKEVETNASTVAREPEQEDDDRELDLELDCELDLELDRELDLELDRKLDREHDLELDRELDLELDRELDFEVERYTTKSQAEEANASVEPATLQQNMSTLSGQNVDDDDITRSVPTVVVQSEKEAETNASTVACESEQEDDDRELDLEVERYTTKWQAEEANASVESTTLQQNMSTPSGQNVDDDDVTRSVPTVAVQSEKEVETNASTVAREPEQEDDDRELDLELDRELDLELDRELDLELDRELDLELDRELDLELDRELDLELDRELDLELDRELDLEVERYTTKWQAEEANSSDKPTTLQQNMSTPSGQNVDDDDVTRSIPMVVTQSEKEVETNASTITREPEQEDYGNQSPHPDEPSKDDA